MTTQEAFEAWATSKGWSIETHGAEYLWPSVQAGWEAWQAACKWQREECAKVCDNQAKEFGTHGFYKESIASDECAEAIRGMK